MPRLTQGHDVLVELSTGLLNRALLALYDAGVIPDHWAPPEGQEMTLAGFELFLLRPFGAWQPRPDGGIGINFRQGFVIRSEGNPGEIAGTWSTVMPVDIVTREIDGNPLKMLRCDCSGLAIDDITLAGDALGLLALPLLAGLHTVLTQQIGELPLSAALPGTGISIMPSLGAGRKFLTIFANLDGRGGPFTGPAEPLVDESAKMAPPDAVVAIDETVYMPQVTKALNDAGLKNGKKFILDIMVDEGTFFDNVLRSITLTKDIGVTIQKGAIKVTGALTADVSNMTDPDVAFTLKFGASLSGNKVVISVIDSEIDIDDTMAAILATAIAGPIGFIIEQVIEEAAGTAIENAITGQSAGFDLPVQAIFVDGATVTNASQADTATAVFVDFASVKIRSDSLSIGVNFRYQFDAVPHVQPIYYRAHRKNKEFHLAGCSFGDKIKSKNLEIYPSSDAAFAAGNDGCKQCLPQFDGDGAGELSVRYDRADAPGVDATPMLTLAYLGKYRFAEFTKPVALVGASDPPSKGIVSSFWTLARLAPGSWAVEIVDGAAVVTRTIKIVGGKRNRVKIGAK